MYFRTIEQTGWTIDRGHINETFKRLWYRCPRCMDLWPLFRRDSSSTGLAKSQNDECTIRNSIRRAGTHAAWFIT